MANIITLSSSPPAIFARSPTPVKFSSPRAKDHVDIKSPEVTSRYHFEPAQSRRAGFREGFTTARQVLCPRSSAENVPVIAPNPSQPKPSRLTGTLRDSSPQVSSVPEARPDRSARLKSEPHRRETADCTVVKVLPSDVRRKKRVQNAEPLNLNKAIARRKDWTPEKPHTSRDETSDVPGFGVRLAQSFRHVIHNAPAATSVSSLTERVEHATKRRKIDVMPPPRDTFHVTKLASAKHGKPPPKPRNRSPAKKPLTITGLTTSHYVDGGEGQENATLMMQFLASTQARMQSAEDPETFETGMARRPTKPKKPRARSKLKSPKTSMRTLKDQDFIFASASQLVREESPTLLRDIVEATKQSEDLLSDPIPTQQTAPVSVESTSPKAGISRFLSRKNLWGAAHRDENDALLYLDDSFDNPSIRASLAGHDALVEGTDSLPEARDHRADSLKLLTKSLGETNTTYDIDDITTPQPVTSKGVLPVVATRSYSTNSKSPPPTRTQPDREPLDHRDPGGSHGTDKSPQKPKIPPKPNYATWTDEALKHQVQEYGFNRIRARKTMIDRLDELWAQKYGLDPAAVKKATKAASKEIHEMNHDRFLSSIHELAPRPAPKAKKPRAKTANASKQTTRSKLVHIPENTGKVEDSIIDIDDIDNTTAFDRLAHIDPFADGPTDVLEPSTAPVKGTGVKAATKSKAKRKTKASEAMLTPPPTLPTPVDLPSSPGFQSVRSSSPTSISMTPLSEAIPAEASLKSQIRSVLLHVPPDNDRRNHQTNPTWHEKILMYDPIVLEDFTAWLNTAGFNAIGVDEEIDAKDVKLWCEENGVCCLWKGGWRGNKAKE